MDGLLIAALVKAENPDIRIVFGGPHVSALRESLMEGESEAANELLTTDTAKVQIPGAPKFLRADLVRASGKNC